jgi:hypothetical protein
VPVARRARDGENVMTGLVQCLSFLTLLGCIVMWLREGEKDH